MSEVERKAQSPNYIQEIASVANSDGFALTPWKGV